jgi:lysophospholipase L1-like esterase
MSYTPSPAPHTAIVPVPKLEKDFYDWYARHEAKCREASASPHDLVFIGDSITHLFEGDPNVPGRGEGVWKEFYGTRRALNLGFGWDRTQNVLWRLDHGEFAGQKPRLAVILIGTNNLTGTVNAPTNSPAEIVAGIHAICRQVAAASPAGRILLMGLLPRGTVDDPLRASVREVNTLLRTATDGWLGVQFADIGDRFIARDGSIPADLMSDGVHPTEKGYRHWAEAIEPVVSRVVGPR